LRKAFDEMNGTGDGVRVPYQAVSEWLGTQKLDDLKQKLLEAETMFRRTGITFAVYGSDEAAERLIPFDIIPRIISAAEWRRLTAGIEQRVRALNAFMYDIYHRQEIIKAGKVPEELVVANSAFVPEMIGVEPPLGIYSHIIGIDIVRTSENDFFVLEDNTRTPSGVSYMLENRETMMHMFPDLFAKNRVAPVEDYPENLLKTLESVAPRGLDREPTIALLTPGQYNSAYFEHSFLADQMGVELVEGHDLTVIDGSLQMKTTQGPCQIDVIYRRIDDDFLDPLVFRSDSVLGVPGLFDLYRAGRVTIVNAPGGGIADDKAIYSYIPEIIKFYTGRAPILQNVPTYNCRNPDELKYVLEHLPELVVGQAPDRHHQPGGHHGDEHPAGDVAPLVAPPQRADEQQEEQLLHGFPFHGMVRLSPITPGKNANSTVTGSTRKTTGTIMKTSLRAAASMSSRRDASRTSAAWACRTSASGVPRSTATATP